jgi:transposase
VAAAVIGDTGDISRFASKDHFAAYNGTAPVEVSSGNRVIYRLSLRGNRRMNHAIHMAAVTQIRYRHTKGRAYYDKKLAEGKTSKEALRALKRQVSDALYQRMRADARRAAAAASTTGPGGHPGNGSVASVAGLHPADRLFGQAAPGPAPTRRSRPDPSKTAGDQLLIPSGAIT